MDEIRAIAVKASSHHDKQIRSTVRANEYFCIYKYNEFWNPQLELLLLKLQHMEKTKYITANDFFPINYTMLFNVNLEQRM